VNRQGLVGAVERIIGWLEAVPYSLLILPARVAVATVFWNSAQTKFANWDATVELFEDEYKLPLLSPDAAAHLTAAYIEVFIYPQAWPTHIQWAAMLVFVLFRGPGKISVDYGIRRTLGLA
jgi:putative oxidoreductase